MEQPSTTVIPGIERVFQWALLGLVASGYLAIAGSGYVDTPTVLLAGLGLLWRAAIVSGVRNLVVPDIAVTITTIAYMVFAPIDYFFLSKTWVTATVHVVFFVASIKILTARTARDYLFVAAVAFVELLSAALFSSSATFFICLAVYLLCAVAAMCSSEVRRLGQLHAAAPPVVARSGRAPAGRLAMVSLVMTGGILVLTAGLFFLLPRTANAALHMFASSRYHLTGFSNDVMLGEVGELKSDSRAVMHITTYQNDLPLNRKWRGLALERFDGRRWSTDPASFRRLPKERSGLVVVTDDWQRRRKGRRAAYRVDIQSVDADAIFVAGTPEFLDPGAAPVSRAASGALRFGYLTGDSTRYTVYSFLDPWPGSSEPHRTTVTEAERALNLKLPKLDPRIPALAREMTRGAGTDFERARLLQTRLRHDYGYSLELASQEPKDPLAFFLFEKRTGYCEYFASAMTVMLRTLGIPARLVNGFQSGIRNPYSGTLVIRASDAHSWVEAYLPGQGWTVFDPTPPANSAPQMTAWTQFALYLDAADTFWREWVLSYDLGQQLTLASRVESQARHLRSRGWSGGFEWLQTMAAKTREYATRWGSWLACSVAGITLLFVLRRQIRRVVPTRRARAGRSNPADASILYTRMLAVMRRKGYQKPAWFTPEEFAASVPLSSAAEGSLERFTDAYYRLRFGGEQGASRDMAAALERLAG